MHFCVFHLTQVLPLCVSSNALYANAKSLVATSTFSTVVTLLPKNSHLSMGGVSSIPRIANYIVEFYHMSKNKMPRAL